MALSILDRGEDGDPIDAQLSRLGAAPSRESERPPWYAGIGLGWTSGTSRRTSRKASMTPGGSFHGSKRETWVISGRSGSMPN